jgi:hypothetical protein
MVEVREKRCEVKFTRLNLREHPAARARTERFTRIKLCRKGRRDRSLTRIIFAPALGLFLEHIILHVKHYRSIKYSTYIVHTHTHINI